jgi:AcrR family transcriptional regulator
VSTSASPRPDDSHPMTVPRGRRPGVPGTRAAILAAARASFAARGFRGTTIRSVAASAGCDPALVHHYFGTKDDLFLAALEIPVDPRRVLASVAAGGVDGAGERLMRVYLAVWDEESTRLPLLAIARGAFEPSGQRLLKDGFLRMVLGPLGTALGVDEPERRMVLVGSQLVGLVMLRYVLAVEPLSSMPADEVVASYAPTLQRYLSHPLA